MKLCTGVTSATSLGTLPRTAARRMSAMSATRFCKCEVSVLKRDGTFSFGQTLESSLKFALASSWVDTFGSWQGVLARSFGTAS